MMIIPPKGAQVVYMRTDGFRYSLLGEVVSAGPKRFRMKRHGVVQEFLTEYVTGWLRDSAWAHGG